MLPVSEPYITQREVDYVVEVVRSGWISSEGKFIREFEERFSAFHNRKFGVLVNSGTSALILALRALDLPAGSEVILPSFTIISCALSCVYNGLVPVFVDSEEDTWNMDISQVERQITDKTKAIIVVHTYGHPVDMDKIYEIAQKYSIYVIEDFAEAIGSEYKGRRCGSFGIISCSSFYANKVITMGEGGICLTDDKRIAEKLMSLRNLAFVPEKRFIHYELGFNFRITNVQAAIGLAQFERISEHINKKIWIGKTYTKLLKPLEDAGLIKLQAEKEWAKSTFWMYGILLNSELGLDAEQVMKALSERGIQTRPFFYPLHLQPAFRKFSWYKVVSLPISEKLYKYGFYLPSGLTLDEEKINFVVEKLKEVLK